MRTLILLTSAAALALGACAKKAPDDLPPPPGNASDAIGPGGVDGAAGAATPGSQADFVASITADRIFFETDSSDVGADDQSTLQSQATWLARYPAKRVTIEGHADERGTREYNIALGERRANATKNALAALGVDPGRMSVISYGKERPDATGSDDGAWARNRRAVTVTVE